MAGMISKQMQAADAKSQQVPAEDEGPGEEDPGYQAALKFAMDALYKNGAAEEIGRQMASASSVSDAMADAAYNIISIVDDRTDGAVAEDLLVLFASAVLKEVADIADAVGVKVKPSDVALALRTMILRFLGEQGVDTRELERAMAQVKPEEFDAADDGEPVAEGEPLAPAEEEAV